MLQGLILFAEGELPTPTTIMGAFIVVTLSLVGLIGWIMRHMFQTTIPAIHADAKAQREHSDKIVKELCDTFKSESAANRASGEETAGAERELCREQFGLVNASIAALATAQGASSQVIVAEVAKHTNEAMQAYRHDLHDKINEAVLGRDLHLAQQAKKKEAG